MDIPPRRPPDFPQGAAQPGLPQTEAGHLPLDRPGMPQLSADIPVPEDVPGEEPDPDMTAPPERQPQAQPLEEIALRGGAAALGEGSRPAATSDTPPERAAGTGKESPALGDVPAGDAAAEGGEASPEARPFTVVEIGSGMAPSLLATDAPDTHRLLTEGGRYTAIDSSSARLAYGEQRIQATLNAREELYGQPCGDVDVSFHEATVDVGAELPPGVEPASADRVILGNMLSGHLPDTTRARIVQTTADLLVPGGEAVVIDTLTPGVVSPKELDRTMTSVGLEYASSDEVEPYGVNSETNPGAYVRRYRKPDAEVQGESDLQPEAAEMPQGPITIVEIGAGEDPILSRPTAPDVKHLYRHGGNYIGLDANPEKLRRGAEGTGLFRAVHTNPEATLNTRFEHATIMPGSPPPESIPPHSADRVVISNVLTDPRVASSSDLCQSIVDTAKQLVTQTGHVVIVGTISPYVYSPNRVDQLMARSGFERVGIDDPRLYHTTPSDTDIGPQEYALRYRLQP